MIVCNECGHHNADGDTFCGDCGAFLEWAGERIAPAYEPPPPEPDEEPNRPGFVARVKAAVGIGDGEGDERQGSSSESAAEPSSSGSSSTSAPSMSVPATPAPPVRARPAPTVSAPAPPASASAPAPPVPAASPDSPALSSPPAAPASPAPPAPPAAAAPTPASAAPATHAAPAEAAAPLQEFSFPAQAPAPTEADGSTVDPRPRSVKAQGIWAVSSVQTPTPVASPSPPAPPAAAPPEPASAPVAPKPAPADPVAPKPATADERAKKAQLAAMVGKPITAEPAPERSAPKRGAAPKAPTAPTAGATPSAATPTAVAARQPTAVAPAPPKRRRPKAPAPGPSKVLKPGDLVCGQCGEGNDPSRRFCRRCGSSLAEAAVVKTPWWRKLLRPFKRRKVEAGDRPAKVRRKARVKTGRGRSIFTALLVIGALVLLVVFPLRGPLTRAVDAVRDRFSSQERVRPVAAEASTSLDTNPASLAIDNHGNTFWAEGAEGDGAGESLRVTFDHAIDIGRIIITPGSTANPGDFVQQPRPREVLINVDSGVTKTIKLADEDKAQSFSLKAEAATVVELQILSVYGGLSGSDCAIAEIEFAGTS